MCTCSVRLNEEKKGIELIFGSKPDEKILSSLKENGFRWSIKQKLWYAKQTPERNQFAAELSNSDLEMDTLIGTTGGNNADKNYDLWEQTRIDSDLNNVDKSLSAKDISAKVRKHIRERFPMCKTSVRTNHNSIEIEVVSSPFDKESDELKSIIEYIEGYANSYRYYTYYNPDSYCDSSYNVYLRIYTFYNYEQILQDGTEEICNLFQSKKMQFEKEEEIRKQKEYEEQIKQRELDHQEYLRQEKIRKENHDLIERTVKIKTVEYAFINCGHYKGSKNDSIDEYEEIIENQDCKISKEIHFNDEKVYNMFCNQLLDDYTFLENTGGSSTDDCRINSMSDYQNMTPEERDTVKWYSSNCVAVYFNNEPKFVIDSQGYSYARYVYAIDENTEKVEEIISKQDIPEENIIKNTEQAEILYTASENILNNNEIDVESTKGFKKYRKLLLTWARNNQFEINSDIIRAVSEERARFKTLLYGMKEDFDSLKEQFESAGFSEGDNFTIVQINSFGSLGITKGKFIKYESVKYAQYDYAIKLTFRPENKRKDYYIILHSKVVIYKDLVEVPESLLWDISSNNGIITRSSKFLSCDYKQVDIVMDYLKQKNIIPVINSYKNF